MKTSVFGCRPLQVVAGFVFIAACPLANVWAQSPAGPLPQTASQDGSAPAAQTTAPRPDVPRTKILAGTWRLNLDESDDPAKRMQQARGSDGNGQYGGRRGGGMGGGWPGGGGLGGRGGMGGGG